MIECRNNGTSKKSFDELKKTAKVASTREVMNYALHNRQDAVLVKYRRTDRGYAYIYRVGKTYFYAEEREDR